MTGGVGLFRSSVSELWADLGNEIVVILWEWDCFCCFKLLSMVHHGQESHFAGTGLARF
jgi:hypothetical protein